MLLTAWLLRLLPGTDDILKDNFVLLRVQLHESLVLVFIYHENRRRSRERGPCTKRLSKLEDKWYLAHHVANTAYLYDLSTCKTETELNPTALKVEKSF